MAKCEECIGVQEAEQNPHTVCDQCGWEASAAHEKAVEVMTQMRKPKRESK